MSQELGPDETLLYVHLPANIPHVDSSHDSNCIRQLGVNSNPINQYMKDFSAVFAQSGFDELPPRWPWDHAIKLKLGADTKLLQLSRSFEEGRVSRSLSFPYS